MSLPVAEQWFVRKRYDDHTTLIYEPHVHPFLRCNIWHIRGRDADLLVTGEGRTDDQTADGKLPAVLAAKARAAKLSGAQRRSMARGLELAPRRVVWRRWPITPCS